MIGCSACGRENEAFFKYCLACGDELRAEKELDVAERPPFRAKAGHTALSPGPEKGPVLNAEGQMRHGIPEEEEARGDEGPASFQTCSSCAASVSCEDRYCRNCGNSMIASTVGVPTQGVDNRKMRGKRQAGCIVSIGEDLSDGEEYSLLHGKNSLGRRGTEISFPDDDHLGAHHVDLVIDDDGAVLRPLDTLNGSFLRIREPVPLGNGSTFRVGRELLRLELYEEDVPGTGDDGTTIMGAPIPENAWGRLCVITGPATYATAYSLTGGEVMLGRDSGDITFPHDVWVSSRHARLLRKGDGGIYLEDLGSLNGSYVRVEGDHPLMTGDHLLVGQQLFRVELSGTQKSTDESDGRRKSWWKR